MEDVAKAAGVSRQTVYAHFPSREALLDAAVKRATADLTAAFDAAGLDGLPPASGLARLLEAGSQLAARYPFLWHLPAVSPERAASRHAPVLERVLELIQRGQDSGDIDATLLTTGPALGRAADEAVKSGRITIE